MTEANARMQQRRDTSGNWVSNNPVLYDGEIGIDTDSYNFKIGNGSTAWSGLSYFSASTVSGEYVPYIITGSPVMSQNNSITYVVQQDRYSRSDARLTFGVSGPITQVGGSDLITGGRINVTVKGEIDSDEQIWAPKVSAKASSNPSEYATLVSGAIWIGNTNPSSYEWSISTAGSIAGTGSDVYDLQIKPSSYGVSKGRKLVLGHSGTYYSGTYIYKDLEVERDSYFNGSVISNNIQSNIQNISGNNIVTNKDFIFESGLSTLSGWVLGSAWTLNHSSQIFHHGVDNPYIGSAVQVAGSMVTPIIPGRNYGIRVKTWPWSAAYPEDTMHGSVFFHAGGVGSLITITGYNYFTYYNYGSIENSPIVNFTALTSGPLVIELTDATALIGIDRVDLFEMNYNSSGAVQTGNVTAKDSKVYDNLYLFSAEDGILKASGGRVISAGSLLTGSRLFYTASTTNGSVNILNNVELTNGLISSWTQV